MSLVDRLIRNSSHSVLAGLASATGAFVASVVVARTLGVDGSASVAIALWIVFFATTVSDIGLTGSLARYMSHYPDASEARNLQRLVSSLLKAFLVAILAGVVVTLIILAVYWQDILTKYSKDPREALVICGLIVTCFIVHMLFAFCYQYLRGSRAFGTITILSISGTVLQIAGVTFGSLNYGTAGALAGYIMGSIPMLWIASRIKLVRQGPPPAVRTEVKRYAISFYLAALFSPLLWVRADLLLVDQFAGARAVGLFAAASTVAALIIQVCQMVCNALLPNIVHAAADDPDSFPKISATIVRFGAFILLPACFIGAALAPDAIGVIYGAAFFDARSTAAVLGCAAGASAITLIVSSVLNAANANAQLARSGAIGAILTIVFGIMLVSRFGMIGAAFGRLAAQTAVAALNLLAVNRLVPGLVRFGWFSRYLATSMLGGLTAYWVASIGAGFAILFAAGIGGLLSYLILSVILVRFVHDERKALLEAVADQSPFLIRMASFALGNLSAK